MVPAFVVVGLGANATSALVISQVVLSITLPVPMIALVAFTSQRRLMGRFVNRRLTRAATVISRIIVLALNAVLLLAIFGVPIPRCVGGG